jgi:hypothetical protein
MAVSWRVTVSVNLDETLEFERVVDADSREEAESNAMEDVSDEDVLNALKDKNAVESADWNGDAETDGKPCEKCDVYFEANELNEDDLCEDCAPDDEDEEEDISQ